MFIAAIFTIVKAWKQSFFVVCLGFFFFFLVFKKFIYFNWRLITVQYCSGFCHTLT